MKIRLAVATVALGFGATAFSPAPTAADSVSGAVLCNTGGIIHPLPFGSATGIQDAVRACREFGGRVAGIQFN